MNQQDKDFHEHLRKSYSETRDRLKSSMEKMNRAYKIPPKDESADLEAAIKVREEIKIQEVPDDNCLEEAKEIRRNLMEARAKCVSVGFSMAAKVFAESIVSTDKLISKYERKKRGIE